MRTLPITWRRFEVFILGVIRDCSSEKSFYLSSSLINGSPTCCHRKERRQIGIQDPGIKDLNRPIRDGEQGPDTRLKMPLICRTIFRKLSCEARTNQYIKSARRNCHSLAVSRKRLIVSQDSSKTTLSKTPVVQALLLTPFTRSLSTQVYRPYVDPKLSYAFGKSQEHLVYSTVARELDKRISEAPDELAYASRFENKEVTFKQLDHDINKVVKTLVQRFKISHGDSVGVFAYNCYNWVVIQFACSRIGAVLTPINPSYKAHELLHVLKTSRLKCLFMQGPKSQQSLLNNHLNVLQSDEIVSAAQNGELNLKNVILMDEHRYNVSPIVCDNKPSIDIKLNGCELHDWGVTENDGRVFRSKLEIEDAGIENANACLVNEDLLSPDDIFAVYYTSGTTGTPKGACVSHFTVINNVRLCQARIRVGRQKDWRMVVVTNLPMFHIFAGVLTALSPIVSNGAVIFPNYKYDIKALVDTIMTYNANAVTLTPTILIDLLSYLHANKITKLPLKIIQSGGAALSPEVFSRTFEALSDLEELRVGYGSTENGSVATLQSIHEPAEMRQLTVGSPVDFTEIRIVKPGTENVLALGERGEIQTRGHNTMVEYLNQPDKTGQVLTSNRWYKTGDIGLMYPHGSIQVCGRIKSMIIKGGENIYPEEVEQMIHKLDYVEDAHVVGVPDKRFGEQVCAWVKLKPGYEEAKSKNSRTSDKTIHKDDVIEFCKRNMTYFKVPKYLFFVNEFPMTSTKKVQAHIMTKMSCEMLGLKE